MGVLLARQKIIRKSFGMISYQLKLQNALNVIIASSFSLRMRRNVFQNVLTANGNLCSTRIKLLLKCAPSVIKSGPTARHATMRLAHFQQKAFT